MLSPRPIVLLLSVSLLAGCAVGAGESGTRITTPAQVTTAGNAMLPVPRITAASELNSQTSTAPANTQFE
jgi:hypothetical protein